MRDLMQRGGASRTASPGCIGAHRPENKEGGASMSPSRPEFMVRVSNLVAIRLAFDDRA